MKVSDEIIPRPDYVVITKGKSPVGSLAYLVE